MYLSTLCTSYAVVQFKVPGIAVQSYPHARADKSLPYLQHRKPQISATTTPSKWLLKVRPDGASPMQRLSPLISSFSSTSPPSLFSIINDTTGPPVFGTPFTKFDRRTSSILHRLISRAESIGGTFVLLVTSLERRDYSESPTPASSSLPRVTVNQDA